MLLNHIAPYHVLISSEGISHNYTVYKYMTVNLSLVDFLYSFHYLGSMNKFVINAHIRQNVHLLSDYYYLGSMNKFVINAHIRQNVHLLSDYYYFPARLVQKRQQLRQRFQREDIERSAGQCTCTATNRQRHHIVCKLEKAAFPLTIMHSLFWSIST